MNSKYKAGDVLIFGKVEGEILDEVIALLTDSEVTHSALVCDERNCVQMWKAGIVKTEIGEYPERSVYHLRHTSETDMSKVVEAADFYFNKSIPYDFPSIVMLGGILIYHRNSYTPEYKAIVDTILGIACWSLDKLLNKIIHGEDNYAMMCSQLVYQCFFDAGGNHRIKIKNGVVWHGRRKENTPRLVDLLSENKNYETFQIPSYDIGNINEDELIHKLYMALKNEPSPTINKLLLNNAWYDTMPKVRKFLDLLEKILETLGSHMPLPSLFITPEDLFHNAENLVEVKES